MRSSARGDEVVVVDDLSTGKRENVAEGAQLHEVDIRTPALADALAGAEVIFHLAAQADVPTSVRAAGLRRGGERRRHASACSRLPATADVVFSSTGGAIYGECERPAREDDPRRPLRPYGVAKLAAEEYLAAWNRLHGTRHTTLRFGNVYGPRQEAGLEGGVVAIFLDAMAAGEETAIFGDGGRRATSSTSTTSSRRSSPLRERAASSTSAAALRRPSPSCTNAAAP